MKKWRNLIVLACAAFIMVIDSTAMNVSISNLVSDLNTDLGTIQMIMSIYTLVMATLMLPCAKIADIFGKKKIFKLGVCIYGIGTLTAAIAPNSAVLFIGWALIEGIAAALMMPTAMSLITSAYEGKERTAAMSIYTAMGAVGIAVGPIFGGFITTYLSWRFVFALEVLIVLYIILNFKAINTIKVEAPDKNAKFDLLGTILLSLTLLSFIGGSLLAKTNGWFVAKYNAPLKVGQLSITGLLLLLGVFLLGTFIFYIVKAKKNRRPALMDTDLFKSKVFNSVLGINLLIQMSMMGIMYIVPIYLQNILAYNALSTGFTLLPLSIILFITSFAAVKLISKFPINKVIATGGFVTALGALYMIFIFSGTDPVTGVQLIPAMVLLGIGIGATISLTGNLGISSLDNKLANQASGTLSTVNNLGSSFATAIFGSMLISGMFTGIANLTLQKTNFLPADMTANQLAINIEQAVNQMNGATLPNLELTADQISNAKAILVGGMNSSMTTILSIIMITALLSGLVSLFVLKTNPKKA